MRSSLCAALTALVAGACSAPKQAAPLLAAHAQEIGATRAELVRFAPSPDGKPAPIYREADLRWDSKEARDKAMASDIPNFATGGVTVLLGQKTN